MKSLKDHTVLITGGTGSFGTKMAEHLLAKGVSEVRILSRDEAKQDALRHRLNDKRLRFYLGDVRDKSSIKHAFDGIDLVFQAAALKQVPSAEFFPLEAVKTNIYGSANVLEAAVESGCKSVVCLSTDKAVYPINAMGMSKALMEKVAQSVARESQGSGTTISITRYGNVMFSRGSVIPFFIDKLRSGQPVTITDASMTRFLMSLESSVGLVEYAFANASPGDIFVKKAPAATIGDLAKALSSLFDLPLTTETIGFRHGEKLFESLLSAEERAKSQDEGDFFRVPMDERSLNYEPFFEAGQRHTQPLEAYTSHNTERLTVDGVKTLLLQIPEIRDALDDRAT